jgi:hypothetical protein
MIGGPGHSVFDAAQPPTTAQGDSNRPEVAVDALRAATTAS